MLFLAIISFSSKVSIKTELLFGTFCVFRTSCSFSQPQRPRNWELSRHDALKSAGVVDAVVAVAVVAVAVVAVAVADNHFVR